MATKFRDAKHLSRDPVRQIVIRHLQKHHRLLHNVEGVVWKFQVGGIRALKAQRRIPGLRHRDLLVANVNPIQVRRFEAQSQKRKQTRAIPQPTSKTFVRAGSDWMNRNAESNAASAART
jgi:hypothetical protein